MKFVIDSLVVLMVVGILGGVFYFARTERQMEQQVELARNELRRFESELLLQSALEGVELSRRGYPLTVEPEWFGGNLPTNPLLGRSYPWLEIASESERELLHPTRRTAMDHSVAQFWYNPELGVIRARVPTGIADATALNLYNRINGSGLTSLFASGDGTE
ncbi:MAG: hypothetical protein ACYS0D_07775 [Planctomycetota bacterium]|jgi:type II secretory pathway pseudopilin PulG